MVFNWSERLAVAASAFVEVVLVVPLNLHSIHFRSVWAASCDLAVQRVSVVHHSIFHLNTQSHQVSLQCPSIFLARTLHNILEKLLDKVTREALTTGRATPLQLERKSVARGLFPRKHFEESAHLSVSAHRKRGNQMNEILLPQEVVVAQSTECSFLRGKSDKVEIDFKVC